MATARQLAANRRIASLPRGPQSASKHGLTAKHIVIEHQEEAEYQKLRAGIVMEYRPHTPQEHRIADQIAQNYWRLLRCRRVETATFENGLGIVPKQSIDNGEGISTCMSNEGRDFDTTRRLKTP